MRGGDPSARYRGPVSATTPQPADLRVGDYRLLTRIGEGGMGVVHLAQAPDGSRVALKVLRPHVIGDDESRQRLAREVASLRRVSSPRVAEVIDADPWGDTPFVATRYVPGLSLHQHVRTEGLVTGDDLRFLGAGLLEALTAVHSVGVLHRDVKPSNVLLEGRAPVLIDFGLARLAEDPRLTHTGWLLGTPGYLAPEILYGEDASAASDVHAWAATLVFAATGRPPYGTGPAMAVMDRVRRGEHDLSAVPPELAPMLSACLAPDPRDRPGTARLLEDLRGPRPAAGGTAVPAAGPATMPYAVAAGRPGDDSRGPVTEQLGDDALTLAGPTDERAAEPTAVEATDPTLALTSAAPAPPVMTPAREPYVVPPPPRPFDPEALPEQPTPRPTAGLERGLITLGLGALVVLGFAGAPYLALAGVGVAVLLLRTLSWTGEASRARQHARGGRRWYDGPLTLLTTPWYLLVATTGTLLLLVSATVLTLLSGLAYLLFGPPLGPGMLLMGGVLALALWWGPGGRRVRRPVRRATALLTRRTWSAWTAIGVLAAGAAACAWFLADAGVVWEPAAGAPWRYGTLLGDVVRWL